MCWIKNDDDNHDKMKDGTRSLRSWYDKAFSSASFWFPGRWRIHVEIATTVPNNITRWCVIVVLVVVVVVVVMLLT